MKILSAAAMRRTDKRAIEEFGIPGIVLMETAGTRVADYILSRFKNDSRVVVLCGPGNNGGDGLVIARLLHRAGFKVFLYSTQEEGAYSGDAAINENICLKAGLAPLRLTKEECLPKLWPELKNADLIVDALLGTGLDRKVEGVLAGLIGMINQAAAPVVAVDIPSGLHADTGMVLGQAVKAEVTLSFAAPKTGLLFYPGARYAGQVYVCDINIPGEAMAAEKTELVTLSTTRAMFPLRAADAHKGSFGKVLIVAGSPGMSGAAALAASAALRAGAGLVYLAAPGAVCPALEAKLSEVIVLALSEKSPGLLSFEAAAQIVEKAKDCDALCIGPGLSPGPETKIVLKEVIKHCPVPMVIDAGALTALGGDPSCLKEAKTLPLLTPHPGEMASLFALKVTGVQASRLTLAREKAKAWRCLIMLKGAATIIASPCGKAAINPTGSPVLATAGTGDLLCGMAASFIAQGLPVYEAGQAAAFVHGLAGDLLGPGRGFTSLDVLLNFKKAFQYIQQSRGADASLPYLKAVRPIAWPVV